MKPDKVSDDSWQFLTRFLDASNSSVVIADARAPDHPIVFANAAFERVTGYEAGEILGRNCRFLQNADREQPDLAVIQGALASGEACECLLRNYRKDGRMFWNKLYLFPFSEAGELVLFVGVQHDVTLEQVLYATLEESLAERARLSELLHDKTARMAQLSLDLIQAQEMEHRRMAHERRDELERRLSSLSMLHHRARAYFPERPAQALWAAAEQELNALAGLVRDMSAASNRPAEDHFGLEVKIRDLLGRQLRAGPAWMLEYAGLPPRLPPEVEMCVHRVVQESVDNLLRHARAEKVIVEISGRSDRAELELSVRDDGAGFDASDLPAPDTGGADTGLTRMRARVELLGGTFHIESVPGRGTRIKATVPLAAADGAY